MSDVGLYTQSLDDFESSNLRALFWDQETWSLYVCFRNGSIIGYKNVGPSIWELLVRGKSKGTVYNEWVRGKYTGMGISIGWSDLRERPKKVGTNVLQNATNFIVRGLAPVEQTIIALNLPDAVAKFLADNEGATVTEVTIKIV